MPPSIQSPSVNSAPALPERNTLPKNTMPIAGRIAGAECSDIEFADLIEFSREQPDFNPTRRQLLDCAARETHKTVFDEIERDLRAARDDGLSKLSENLRVIDKAEEKALKAVFDHARNPAVVQEIFGKGQLAACYGVADIAIALSELRHNGENQEVCDNLAAELCKLVEHDGLGERSGFSAYYRDNAYGKVQKLIKKVNEKFDALPERKDIFSSVLEREVMPAIRDYLQSRLGELDSATWQKIESANGLASRAAAAAAQRMTQKLKTFERDGSHVALHAKVNQWRVAQHWAELMRATKLAQVKDRDDSAVVPPQTTLPDVVPTSAEAPASERRPKSAEVSATTREPYSGIANFGSPVVVQVCGGKDGQANETAAELLKEIFARKGKDFSSLPRQVQRDLSSSSARQVQQELSSSSARLEGQIATPGASADTMRSVSQNSQGIQTDIDNVAPVSEHIYDTVAVEQTLPRNNEGNNESNNGRLRKVSSGSEDFESDWTDSTHSDAGSDSRGTTFQTTAQIHAIPSPLRVPDEPSINKIRDASNRSLVPESTVTPDENRVLPFSPDIEQTSRSSQTVTELPIEAGRAYNGATVDPATLAETFPSIKARVEKFNGRLHIKSSELSSDQIDSLHNASSGGELASVGRQSGYFRLSSRGSLNEVSVDRRPLSTTSRPDQAGPFGFSRRSGGR